MTGHSTRCFGFRARDESRKLRWGDVQLQQQNDSQEVLVWLAERGTKTRHGQERGKQRSFQPKIYATNTARCPDSFYKKFRCHRPVEINAPESPFYLAVRHNRRSNEEVWYMKAPLGKIEIGKFLSTTAKNAGLHREGKKVTNHSVRKTCISMPLDADVPENFVAQLSGHKSTESLQSYKSASAKHQKRMSLTLSIADVTGSRDEVLSSDHNQEFEVVSRSTTDIDASSPTTTLIDPSSDPLLSSTAPIFTGANIGSINGCTFPIFQGNVNRKLPRMKGSVGLLSIAMRTIDFEAIFYQLCQVLN